MQTTKQTGYYLYAIIADVDQDPVDLSQTLGIDGGPLRLVTDGRLSAVVSDAPNDRVRPERRRLASHQDVLKHLLARGTLLPMAFGMIADGESSIDRILTLNRDTFIEQIDRLDGKVEMGLRVVWDVPNIFEYFVDLHPDLRIQRDSLFRGGREPTRDDSIELGRLFDRMLSHEREVLTERALRTIQKYCVDVKENKVRNERDVMNLACLVRRDGQKAFEQGVFEAARQFDNHYAFDFNGPWPPYNFVEVDLQV